MAKKNFDDFINAAGKKPKPTPEEVEAMAKQLHNPAVPAPTAPVADTTSLPPAMVEAPVMKKDRGPTQPKAAKNPPPTTSRSPSSVNSQASSKEKVRITIDLAKDLYKRMKLAVVENETEISAYIRQLIENDLSRK